MPYVHFTLLKNTNDNQLTKKKGKTAFRAKKLNECKKVQLPIPNSVCCVISNYLSPYCLFHISRPVLIWTLKLYLNKTTEPDGCKCDLFSE